MTTNSPAFHYEVKESSRVRSVRLTVHTNGAVVVTIPINYNHAHAHAFVESKKEWVMRHVEKAQQNPPHIIKNLTRADYQKYKDFASYVIGERLAFFKTIYAYDYQSFSVRDQKSRWGSCSKKGGLHFNYKIIFLTPEQRDYIIVHELCHLKEFNHSPAFWKLVERAVPHYKTIRKELRNLRVV